MLLGSFLVVTGDVGAAYSKPQRLKLWATAFEVSVLYIRMLCRHLIFL
jgi:hypothetical protein